MQEAFQKYMGIAWITLVVGADSAEAAAQIRATPAIRETLLAFLHDLPLQLGVGAVQVMTEDKLRAVAGPGADDDEWAPRAPGVRWRYNDAGKRLKDLDDCPCSGSGLQTTGGPASLGWARTLFARPL